MVDAQLAGCAQGRTMGISTFLLSFFVNLQTDLKTVNLFKKQKANQSDNHGNKIRGSPVFLGTP